MEAGTPMTIISVSLDPSSIHHLVRQAVGDLTNGAESIRLVATALGGSVGELLATAGAEELRQTAAVVRTHSIGVLTSAVTLASKAERLETLADVRDSFAVDSETAEEE